jgi:hypothetical protein
MQSRHAVEAVDRMFQDLMDNEEPFGEKSIFLVVILGKQYLWSNKEQYQIKLKNA